MGGLYLWPQGADCMRIMCVCVCVYIYVNATLYNIFIEGRENAEGINAVDLNNPNIYIRDIVAVFKPLLGLTP